MGTAAPAVSASSSSSTFSTEAERARILVSLSPLALSALATGERGGGVPSTLRVGVGMSSACRRSTGISKTDGNVPSCRRSSSISATEDVPGTSEKAAYPSASASSSRSSFEGLLDRLPELAPSSFEGFLEAFPELAASAEGLRFRMGASRVGAVF